VNGALSKVGAQSGSHAKVLDNGRTGEEVQPSRPHEGNHIIGIHRGAMPQPTRGKSREQAIASRPLDHQVKHVHHRVEQEGGKEGPLVASHAC
jgi:hypothetical protein